MARKAQQTADEAKTVARDQSTAFHLRVEAEKVHERETDAALEALVLRLSAIEENQRTLMERIDILTTRLAAFESEQSAQFYHPRDGAHKRSAI